MSVVGVGIAMRRFRYILPGMKATQAKDYIDKEADKKKREERAVKELQAMKPILDFFRVGYKDVLGEENVENIIRLYNQPIAKYALIIRLGNELEGRGLSRKTWETIASKAFLWEQKTANNC